MEKSNLHAQPQISGDDSPRTASNFIPPISPIFIQNLLISYKEYIIWQKNSPVFAQFITAKDNEFHFIYCGANLPMNP